MAEGRALILGFLSTVGDIEVLEQVQSELSHLGLRYDVAPYKWRIRMANTSWLDARRVDPSAYTHLIVVCGPFSQKLFHEERDIFSRFAHCVWIGVNLSMIDSIEAFNPFDALLERDSARMVRPDLSLLQRLDRLPVVGLCLASPQPEYGTRQLHDQAAKKIHALLTRGDYAVLELDTKWPASRNAQRTANPAQFESLCAKVDVLVTTRLHGMVLALKNSVPVLAIDAIAGGDKVTQQAKVMRWAEVFAADTVSDLELDAAFNRCLSAGARARASDCANAARERLFEFSGAFAEAVSTRPGQRSYSAATSKINNLRARWILFNQLRKERRRTK